LSKKIGIKKTTLKKKIEWIQKVYFITFEWLGEKLKSLILDNCSENKQRNGAELVVHLLPLLRVCMVKKLLIGLEVQWFNPQVNRVKLYSHM
jgi:hypothetical protein